MYHQPVLLEQSVEKLVHKQEGIYVDVTFGGGGHSKHILNKISQKASLVSFDQDDDATQNAIDLEKTYPNFQFIKQNFRFLQKSLQEIGITQVDGILADLGVSSHQFDTPERGFSFRFDARLDMRMNIKQEIDAQYVVNHYSEQDLHKIFGMYGEIKNAKTLAQTIVKTRKTKTIQLPKT